MRLSHAVTAAACLLVAPHLTAQSNSASDSTHTAFLAVMKDDLRRLVIAQDASSAHHGTYASRLPRTVFQIAPGHEVKIITTGQKGYSATVTAAQEPGLTCGMFEGAGQAPNAVIFKAREPACWRPLTNRSLSAE